MICFFALYFLCFGYSFGSPTECNTPKQEYIVGGENANIEDFPYQLGLGIERDSPPKYWHNCGASILNPSWALSAAHCIDTSRIRGLANLRIVIRAGSSISDEGGTIHPVETAIAHPNYSKAPINDYDVCVIQVSIPFSYSERIQPIALATATPPVGTSAVVTGWGYTSFSDITHTIPGQQLQKLATHVVNSSVCKDLYGETFTPSKLCASGPEQGKYVWKGDSGGPLVAEGKQIGIVSTGIRIYEEITPFTMYIDVAYVREWIISAIDQ